MGPLRMDTGLSTMKMVAKKVMEITSMTRKAGSGIISTRTGR